jgi:hypothetical protein
MTDPTSPEAKADPSSPTSTSPPASPTMLQELAYLRSQLQVTSQQLLEARDQKTALEHSGRTYLAEKERERSELEKKLAEAESTRSYSAGFKQLPRVNLDVYEGGSEDLQQWCRQCLRVFTFLKTPEDMRAQIAILTALKGPALAFIDSLDMTVVAMWDFAQLCAQLQERFQLTVKQVDHRAAWRAISMRDKEDPEGFFARFVATRDRVQPRVSDSDAYWAWYFGVPSWVQDRLNMAGCSTLAEAVDVTRKAMAGASTVYGARAPQQQPPATTAAADMQIDTIRRGRGGRGGQIDTLKTPGEGKGGKSKKGGKGEKTKDRKGTGKGTQGAKEEACHTCGHAGHWKRECRTKPSNYKEGYAPSSGATQRKKY